MSVDDRKTEAAQITGANSPATLAAFLSGAKKADVTVRLANYVRWQLDDTPADSRWLEQVGFTRDVSDWKCGCVVVRFGYRSQPTLRCSYADLCENPTRGQVRTLCQVAGIELREDA